MKKFTLLAAFAAMVGSASAATITWGFGGPVYISEDGATPVLSTAYAGDVDWKLALVYVGQNKSTFDIDDLTSASVVATTDYSVYPTTNTKNANKWNPATTKTTTTAYDDGASFAVVLYNAGDFDYVYALSNGAAGAAVTSAITVSDMSARGSGMVYGAGSSTAAGVVKVSVPEPGIACMALLGIGMMIKRRKA